MADADFPENTGRHEAAEPDGLVDLAHETNGHAGPEKRLYSFLNGGKASGPLSSPEFHEEEAQQTVPPAKEIRTEAPVDATPTVIAAPAPQTPEEGSKISGVEIEIPEFPPNVVPETVSQPSDFVSRRQAKVPEESPGTGTRPYRGHRGRGVLVGVLGVFAAIIGLVAAVTYSFERGSTNRQSEATAPSTMIDAAMRETEQSVAASPQASSDALRAEWARQLEADGSAFAAMDFLLARLEDPETAAAFAPHVDSAVETLSRQVDSAAERALAYETLQQVYPDNESLEQSYALALEAAALDAVEAGQVNVAAQWYSRWQEGNNGATDDKALATLVDAAEANLARDQQLALYARLEALGTLAKDDVDALVTRAPQDTPADVVAELETNPDATQPKVVEELREVARRVEPAPLRPQAKADTSEPVPEPSPPAPDRTQTPVFEPITPGSESNATVSATRPARPPRQTVPVAATARETTIGQASPSAPAQERPAQQTAVMFDAYEPTAVRINPQDNLSGEPEVISAKGAKLAVSGPQEGVQSITATVRDAAGRPVANQVVKVVVSVGIQSHHTKLLTTDARGVATLDVTQYLEDAKRRSKWETFRYAVTTPGLDTEGAYVTMDIEALK